MYKKQAKHINTQQNMKWIYLIILFFIAFVIIPISFSKYTSTLSETININIRKPKYTVNFHANRDLLPDGYVEVGYLETNGPQYINLGNTYPISVNTRIEMGASFEKSWLYGYSAGEGKRYGGTTASQFTGSAKAEYEADAQYHDYIFDHAKGATIDGIEYNYSGTPSGSSGKNNIYLFRANGSTVFVKGSIYYFRQYENNELVYDLIPCYRESDNVKGMYDLISDTFFTNAGLGVFKIGDVSQEFTYDTSQKLNENIWKKEGYNFVGWNTKPDGTGIMYEDKQDGAKISTIDGDVVELYAQWERNAYKIRFSPNYNNLPDEYTELEYIESAGSQYILTDIKPNNNTGIHAKLASKNVTNDSVFVGCGTVTDNKRFWFGNNADSVYFGWNTLYSRNAIGTQTIKVDEINEIEMNYMNNRKLIYNGVSCFDNLPELQEKDVPIAIFGYYHETQKNINLSTAMRLYELRISENENIIGDFVPCYRNSDGVKGLYDLIQNKFYANGASGDFITSKPQDLTFGSTEKLNPNTYKKIGYTFIGWNTKPDGSGTAYSDGQEIKVLSPEDGTAINLYAQWRINDYTVKFDGNTGSGNMEDMKYVYNESKKLNPNNYTKEGYTFLGWNTERDGSGTSFSNEQEVVNLVMNANSITLYAQWKKNNYTLNFYPNRDVLPSEYTELEYIESTGSQYIVTDITPSDNTGIYLKLASKNVTDDRVFLGCGTVTEDKRFWIGNSSGNIYYGWNSLYSKSKIGTQSIKVDEINEIEMNYMNNRKLVYNGVSCYENLTELKEKTMPITIFGYYNEVSKNVTSKVSMELYKLKISENSDVIADFVPCFKTIDGKKVIGLYDLTQSKFYENAADTEFLEGISTQQFEYDTAQILNANNYEKEGYTFAGWNTKPDGSGIAYTDKQEVINLSFVDGEIINLYAQWEKI